MTGTRMKTNQNIRENLIALTKDLVLIPGTAQRPDDLERCISFVEDYLNNLDNIRIFEYRHKNIPSIVALPEGISEPEILLVSHLDVISHSDVGVYNPSVKNGRIYGPGTGDMKGAVSIMMELFKYFHNAHPGISLGLALSTDEEQGGNSGIGYLFDNIGLRCGISINPDGGSLNEITIAEKGVVHLRVSCSGHSSHAARPWLGNNALEILIEKVLALKKYFNDKKKTDDNWYPTCAITMVTTPNKSFNRVPENAEAILDIRFPPPYTVDKILSESSMILGNDLEIHIHMSAEPVDFESDPLFQETIEDVIKQPVILNKEDGASDSRYIQRYGIPVIIARPKVGELHTKDEWIDIESMVDFYKICKLFIERKLLI
jgi:succinyl-diaminopimelate desuccinylase